MSWGVALRNAVGLGLGGIPSLLNAPPYAKLAFNFLSGQLDPRITFSRTSNATLIGSNGQLQYAPHNLLTYSEQFDNAAWTKTQSTIAANSVAAPDGTTTADKIVEDTAVTVSHYVQSPIITPAANIAHAGSVYVKAAERRYIAVTLTGGGGPDRGAFFDGLTGAYTGGFAGGLPYTVTDVGNGWFRYALTDTPASAASYALRVYVCDAANNTLYTGNGTSGIYVWGAQLNVGALQPYYQTDASAYYGPRFDYNPTTLAPLGLLIEEQRTNSCLYSNDLSQANWSKGSTVSVSYNTVAAPDGTTTADTITVVTGADTGVHQSIACSSSTAYTFSLYVKLGTMVASDYKIAIYDNTNAAFIAVDIVPTQTPSATTWTRITYTFTTPATCVSVRPYCFRNSLSAATSVNVWGMQLEQGAFATSVIPTTTTALTRAADVASMTGANFSNWYNPVEGTLYFEGSVVGSTGADQIGLNANNNAFTERVRLGKGPTTPRFTIVDDGVVQADLNGGTWAVNAVKKLAGAYAANSIALSVDGATPLLDTVATIPTPTQLQIGNEQLATFLNGHIRSFKYYPTRLRDSALQALTR